MTDILFTYSTAAHRNTYGDVYLRVGDKLSETGHQVRFLDLCDVVSNYTGSLDSSVIAEGISQFDPKFIISDEESLFLELSKCFSPTTGKVVGYEREMVDLLMEEIDTCLFTHYWGRIQSNSSRSYAGSVEKKESFVIRMREENICTPTTILRTEFDGWNYASLQALLGMDGFFVKEEGKHRSKGVHYVRSEKEFTAVQNRGILAQERIRDNGRFPCSLRVITFGSHILGASLLYNTKDEMRSNVYGSVRGCPLTIPMQKEYADWLTELMGSDKDYLWKHGVLSRFALRGDVKNMATIIGAMPSRSLLRGSDFCFDELGVAYLLETQTGPGDIRRGNFVKMLGLVPLDVEYNISVVVETLTRVFEKMWCN